MAMNFTRMSIPENRYYSFFSKIENDPPKQWEDRGGIQVFSLVPPDQLKSYTEPLDIAIYDDVYYIHENLRLLDEENKVVVGEITGLWNGLGMGDVPFHKLYFPFMPIEGKPGEYAAIFEIKDNGFSVSHLQFLEAGKAILSTTYSPAIRVPQSIGLDASDVDPNDIFTPSQYENEPKSRTVVGHYQLSIVRKPAWPSPDIA